MFNLALSYLSFLGIRGSICFLEYVMDIQCALDKIILVMCSHTPFLEIYNSLFLEFSAITRQMFNVASDSISKTPQERRISRKTLLEIASIHSCVHKGPAYSTQTTGLADRHSMRSLQLRVDR